MLMLDFLSRLEKLLPVPDIQQVEEPACKAELSVLPDHETVVSYILYPAQRSHRSSNEWKRFNALRAAYSIECVTVSCPTLALVCQTATLLNAVPSALDECVHSVPDPRHLKTVLHYHAMLGHFDFLGDVDHVICSLAECGNTEIRDEILF